MKTKSKISGYMIRSAVYAVFLSVAFIAASWAFQSPNKWSHPPWRLPAITARRKVRANPERSASQSASCFSEQLKTFTGNIGSGPALAGRILIPNPRSMR